MVEEILNMTVLELAEAIRTQKVTSEEAVRAVLGNIDEHECELHAYLSVWKEEALVKARECDERIRKTYSNLEDGSGRTGTIAESGKIEELPPLLGVPIAVKDNLVTEGYRTTCGSKMLAEYIPSFSATCVEKLQKSGAILLGKTNLDEFGMGVSTETSYFGGTTHPLDPSRVPGGSSGGSAAAVRSGEAWAALGTDTGGSVRQPAAYCGLVGLRPTYGAVSRHGLVAFSSSMDTVGPLTRATRDAAALFNIVTGADERDQTSFDAPKIDLDEMERYELRGKKVGIPRQLVSNLSPEVQEAMNRARTWLADEGAVVEEVDLPILEYAVAIYYILSSAEASSNLSRYDGIRYGYRASDATNVGELFTKTRSEGFGLEVKRRILLGNYVLSSEHFEDCYRKAEKAREKLSLNLAEALTHYDLLLCPTSPMVAPKRGTVSEDPLTTYISDLCTVPASLAGIPAISIPASWMDPKKKNDMAEGDASMWPRLPVGLQLMGRRWGEQEILGAARYIEKCSLGVNGRISVTHRSAKKTEKEDLS